MADRNLIESLKRALAEDENSAQRTRDISDLKESQEELVESIDRMVSQQKEMLNDSRRDARTRDTTKTLKDKESVDASDAKTRLENLRDSASNLSAVLASIGLAFAGLRGWEARAIAQIGSGLRSLSDSIVDGVRNLNARILRAVGIVDDAGELTPRIARMVDGLRDSTVWIETLFTRMRSFFNPIQTAGRILTSFIGGEGARIFQMFRGTAAPFLNIVRRVLWPLGVIMSAIDGISAFRNTEGSLWERFSAGIGAAIGDFFGAPLDLLGNLTAYVLEQFGMDRLAEMIRNFSFEEAIGGFITDVFNWFGLLFSDPGEALSQLWRAHVSSWSSVGQFIFDNVARPAWDWISDKFSNISESIVNLWNNATGGISDFASWIWQNTGGALWDWASGIFSNVSEYLTNTWSNLPGMTSNFASWLWNNTGGALWIWASGAFGNAAEYISNNWDAITGSVSNLGRWIWNNAVSPFFDWINETFGNPIDSIRTWYNNLLAEYEAEDFIDLILSPIRTALQWINDLIPSVEEIRNFIQSLMPDWLQNLNTPERTAAIERAAQGEAPDETSTSPPAETPTEPTLTINPDNLITLTPSESLSAAELLDLARYLVATATEGAGASGTSVVRGGDTTTITINNGLVENTLNASP